MSASIDQKSKQHSATPDTVRFELLGKWLAWDSTGLRILAHADTLDDLVDEVKRLGIDEPVYQKVPSSTFIGAACR